MIELADDRGGRTDAAGSRHRKERDVATETQRAHEEDLEPATATRRPAAVAVEAAAGAAQIALTLGRRSVAPKGLPPLGRHAQGADCIDAGRRPGHSIPRKSRETYSNNE